MQLDYPRMLYKPDGSMKVVPDAEARKVAEAAGWFDLADLPQADAVQHEPEPEAPKPHRKPRKKESGE